MSVWDKYKCEGQMDIFDLIEPPSMPMFFNDEPAPMYISSTFMDKDRRKRK